MLARTSLILALIVSLLFVTQAQPMSLPVEMKHGGTCAAMQCERGCCGNKACCKEIEQQRAPQVPAPAPQHTHFQLAALELRVWVHLFLPPKPSRPFVILDEASTAHALAPRAMSCIRLI